MLPSILKKTQQQLLFIYFLKRIKSFWNKKVPLSKGYEFSVHDPFEVLGEDSGYEKLYLVGDNWTKEPHKPIAIAVGFNDWKFGFTADYLPEYRVAFVPRKLANLNLAKILFGLQTKPALAVIWGYTETKWLNRYLKYINLDIWRVEDGFIRSADLGANGATPYSLVFDKTGLYYNTDGSSELDNLLDNYNIPEQLLREGSKLFELFQQSNTSKYNPYFTKKDRTIKTTRSILVIGQVDSDASLRFGNTANWNAEDIVRLAKKENPSAQITYRPHPEIFKGYQDSKFKFDKVKFFANVQSPEVDIIDAISRADHIYTICSLAGLEAVLRGKKVTVLGRSFYGGWGLTDDRVEYSQRNRKLSKLELFIIIYIIYPKYLCDLENPVLGLTSTIYRIRSDRDIGKSYVAKKLDIKDKESLSLVSNSYSWPLLLVKASHQRDDSAFLTILGKVELNQYSDIESETSQTILSHFLLGLATSKAQRKYLLTVLRKNTTYTVYNKILLELTYLGFSEELSEHWIWLLGETDNEYHASDILESNTAKFRDIDHSKRLLKENKADPHLDFYVSGVANLDNEALNIISKDSEARSLTNENQNINPQPDTVLEPTKISINDLYVEDSKSLELTRLSNSIYEELDFQLKFRKLDQALNSCLQLLILGYSSEEVFGKLCRLLNLLALPKELFFAAKIYKGLNILGSNRNPVVQEMLAYQKIGFRNDEDLLRFIIDLINLKPNLIVAANFLLNNFLSNKDLEEQYLEVIESQLNFDNDIDTRKIQAYVAVERFDKAELTSLKLLNTNQSIPSLVQYSQALSYNDKIDRAIQLIEDSIEVSFVKLNVQELLRLYVLDSQYEKSLKLIRRAEERGLEIGDMHLRKAYFGNRMIYEALEAFTKINIVKFTKIYYKEKYIDVSSVNYSNINSVLLLAIFGPGDEIRFASIYNSIIERFKNKKIYMSCSPRLKELFSNSFKEITFLDVPRPRGTDLIDLENYTQVPGSDLFQSINNNAVETINKVEGICYVTDMLHVVRKGYEDFIGDKYLYCNPDLKEIYNVSLKTDRKLVGLSWRSSLTTTARNEHYLSIEQLEPLFSIEGIQFVNLQYDDCSNELSWINERYPGSIIDFDELDQYNDFDGVAALMSCMDLIIAPATTVAELAGALGINTWLFSNSSEINWRKKDSLGTDVWHNSIKIVDVPEKGNKTILVEEIYRRLINFSDA